MSAGPSPLAQLLPDAIDAIEALPRRDRAVLEICASWIDSGASAETLLRPGALQNLEMAVQHQGYPPEGTEPAVLSFTDLGWLRRLEALRRERVSRECDLCTDTPWVRTHQMRTKVWNDPEGKERREEGPWNVCAKCAALIDKGKVKKLAKRRVEIIGVPGAIAGVAPPMPRKVALLISEKVVEDFFKRKLD